MKNTQDKLRVKSIYDTTIKTVKGIYQTKSPTKQQIKKYKRSERDSIDDETGIYIYEELALSMI